MTVRVLILTAALATMTAVVASADNTATPRVDRREVRQQARIQQGVKSGELTKGEANRLERGQTHVDRLENHAKADGKVTPAERARLARAQNRQSRRIYRLKHNDNVR